MMQWLHPRGKSAGYGLMKQSKEEEVKRSDE
jgi:hypothetical protein